MRFFAPQTRHVAPMGVKFDTADGTEGPLLRVKFHPHGCNDKGTESPKLKFCFKPRRGVSLVCDFHIICEVCTLFQDAVAVKILLICSRGYGVMGLLS